MKIPIIDLTLENVQKLKLENEWSDHFNLILWPRILVWLGLKEHLNENRDLSWKIHYTPENMHNNFVSMHVNDPNETFNFYFQIPLVQNLSFNLYLGDSTYNFFEIHPYLISKGVINKDAFKIEATSTILPHLVLSTPRSKYDRKLLMEITEENFVELTKNDPLINLLISNFNKFIPPLQNIISGNWKL